MGHNSDKSWLDAYLIDYLAFIVCRLKKKEKEKEKKKKTTICWLGRPSKNMLPYTNNQSTQTQYQWPLTFFIFACIIYYTIISVM